MISIILAGRNDDYGKGFSERLFRACSHNVSQLSKAGVDFEFVFVEWNPLPDRPPLALEFVARFPKARAIVIPPEIHNRYSLNPTMPFHEMPAKNAGLRRARGEVLIAANADILFGDELMERVATGDFRPNTLFRAHRIDVKPDLDWTAMQDPANQLQSGEGRLPPCPYLGAGGDFCLASRDLWHSLRGFNEGIRFSTRAKDWQFYLSALAQGVTIEFIGKIYHLDHEVGFRNTSPKEVDLDTAHFGGPWDIEFGLPVRNGEDWGFRCLTERPWPDSPSVTILEPGCYAVPSEQNDRDLRISRWLTPPCTTVNHCTAILFHAICAAHRSGRRMICRMKDMPSLIALAGFCDAARDIPVDLFCDEQWPEMPGFTPRPFLPEPKERKGDDWIFEQSDDGASVRECGTGRIVDVVPSRLRIDNPRFYPLHIRRFLRACLVMQRDSIRRIAVLGAGSHTENLLRWGLPDSVEVKAVANSKGQRGQISGIPVTALEDLRPEDFDALLISSCSYEPEMIDEARSAGFTRLISLYESWPAVCAGPPKPEVEAPSGEGRWNSVSHPRAKVRSRPEHK